MTSNSMAAARVFASVFPANSFPATRSSTTPTTDLPQLRDALRARVSVALGLHSASGQPSDKPSPTPGTPLRRQGTLRRTPRRESHVSTTYKAQDHVAELVQTMLVAGVSEEALQITFAEMMNEAMAAYIKHTFRGVWSAPSNCIPQLHGWIRDRYVPLASRILEQVDESVSAVDIEKWTEMATGRLARLRIHELFDIVTAWPNAQGALEDLRISVTTPQRRLELTDVFSDALRKRLLHPGMSTLQILQTYISMIWSFHALDHSKVLLDRVAYALQVYVCSRDDTVRIIISGLLADTKDEAGNIVEAGGEKLVELALILNHEQDDVAQGLNEDAELDWDDMDWLPDPVDAGPGYKRSKSADIIGTLIGVLGSQDVFIKEFQCIIGENLLKHTGNFEKEVRLSTLEAHHRSLIVFRSKCWNY